MSTLTSTPHDSLPYIDAPPTPSQRAAAEALITAHLPLTHHNTPHPGLPPLPPVTTRQSLLSNSISPPSKTTNGIDMSRYEPVDSSTLSNPTSLSLPSILPHLRSTATNTSHLSTRHTNLTLLSTHGQNSWLLLNHHLEAELSSLEKEIEVVEAEIQGVNQERRSRQEGVRGEVEALGQSWRDGVRGAVEVGVEVGRLRNL